MTPKSNFKFQLKEIARIHGKSVHLANCSQLFKQSFKDKNLLPLARTIN